MGLTDEETSRLLSALSNSTRRRIIDKLRARERQSLFELHARLIDKHGIHHSRQAFSRHLAVLEEAGILEEEWSGTTKLHSLHAGPLTSLVRGWLGKF